jgi:hypothetical protein
MRGCTGDSIGFAQLMDLIQNISNAARQQASSVGAYLNTMNIIQEITRRKPPPVQLRRQWSVGELGGYERLNCVIQYRVLLPDEELMS